jgi:redox-sensitive bicupin YhaK (pirin superfamily)
VVELGVGPRLRPLGGTQVNRVWPTARRKLIGPFIFFDHLQPTELPPGLGIDVPPHPHIGLATITYLFAGELIHRDSLGVEQAICPGDVNWMTAGRGIVHSERSGPGERARPSMLHGVQCWVALPTAAEHDEPSFRHWPADVLPIVETPGIRLRVIAGAAFGATAPVATATPLFYVEADVHEGASVALDADLGQRGVYVVSGTVVVDGSRHGAGRLIVLRDGVSATLTATVTAKLMMIGGAPLGGERYIWWNFVASTVEQIEAAKLAWSENRFAAVPGDEERMSMPTSQPLPR